MPYFVIGNDMHLRHKTWPTTDLALFDDAYVALEELVSVAKKRGAGLIFPGDMFDHGISTDSPKNLDELMRITRGFGDIVCTVGNHDRTGGSGGGVNPEWVEVVNRKYPHHDEVGPIMIGDNWMYEEETSYTTRDTTFAVIHHAGSLEEFEFKLNQLVKKNFDFQVLVVHQALKEMLGVYGTYEVDLNNVGKKLIDRGCQLVVAGHVHAPEDWTHEGLTLVSPGESYSKTLDDGMKKRFPLVKVEPGITRVEWVEYQQCRRVVHVVASETNEYENAEQVATELRLFAESSEVAKLDPRIRKPVLSMCYVPVPGFKAKIQSILGDEVALFESRVRDAGAAKASRVSLVSETVSIESTLEDIVRVTSNHTQEGAVRDDLIRIQNGESPEAVIEERIRRETA